MRRMEQIRARIEAVAYMEVYELLDLVERVAGGVDRLVEASYVERRMEELDIAELFRESLAGIGFVLPDDVLQHIVVLDHSAYSNSMHVDDETLDTLRELRGRGLRLGIVSNMTLRADLMRQDLDRLGIGPLVDATTFSSETGVRKPDPRIFQTALERVGAAAGDGVRRGPAAGRRRRGAGSRHANRAHPPVRQEEDPDIAPDALVRSLGELPAIVAGWSGEP